MMKTSLELVALITAAVQVCSTEIVAPAACSLHLQTDETPATVAFRLGDEYSINFIISGSGVDFMINKTENVLRTTSVSQNKTIYEAPIYKSCSGECTYLNFSANTKVLTTEIWCKEWKLDIPILSGHKSDENITLTWQHVTGEAELCEGYEQYDPKECRFKESVFNTVRAIIICVSSVVVMAMVCTGLYLGNHKFGWRVRLQRRTTWRLTRHSLLTLRFSSSTTHTTEDRSANTNTVMQENLAMNIQGDRVVNRNARDMPANTEAAPLRFGKDWSISGEAADHSCEISLSTGPCEILTAQSHASSSDCESRLPSKVKSKTRREGLLHQEQRTLSKSRSSPNGNKLRRKSRSRSEDRSTHKDRSLKKAKFNRDEKSHGKGTSNRNDKPLHETISADLKPPALLPKECSHNQHTQSQVVDRPQDMYSSSSCNIIEENDIYIPFQTVKQVEAQGDNTYENLWSRESYYINKGDS
nr:uncharacterized protein LOC123760056 [Procambarus clarkii]